MNRSYGSDYGMVIQEILHRHAYENENEEGDPFEKCIKPQSSDTCRKKFVHNQKVRIYGLFDNGENGQGIARNITISATMTLIKIISGCLNSILILSDKADRQCCFFQAFRNFVFPSNLKGSSASPVSH